RPARREVRSPTTSARRCRPASTWRATALAAAAAPAPAGSSPPAPAPPAATPARRNPDPMLGLLQNNGGPTQTHALLTGSPAIDQGRSDAIPNLDSATDQRGFDRSFDDTAIANAS